MSTMYVDRWQLYPAEAQKYSETTASLSDEKNALESSPQAGKT